MTVYEIQPGAPLNEAISHLKPTDILYMRGGTYIGPVTVEVSGESNAPITMAAYPNEPVKWLSPSATHLLQVNGSHVTVKDIEIDKENRRRMAVRIRGHNVIVKNCHIHNARWYTMIQVDGHDCLLENNRIHNNGYGPDRDAHGVLNRGEANGLTVRENVIFDVCGDCIQIEDVAGHAMGLAIMHNHLYTTQGWQSENGIDLKSGDGLVGHNDIHSFRDCHYWAGNPDGLGSEVDYPSGGSGAGILIHRYTKDLIVEHNYIHDNTMGIRLISSRGEHEARNLTLRRNTIMDIAYDDPNPEAWGHSGIYIAGYFINLSIIHNTFDVEFERAIRAQHDDLEAEIRDNYFPGQPEPPPEPDWKSAMLAQLDVLDATISANVAAIKAWVVTQ